MRIPELLAPAGNMDALRAADYDVLDVLTEGEWCAMAARKRG